LVRESDRQLMPLLKTGDRVNGVTVRRITSAAVDDGALIVTDGFAVYRYDGIQKWSATAIVDSDREAGFTTEATGIYGNSYYLFNKTDKQVKKFDVSSLDEEPVDWLGDKAMKHTAHVVDMAVDTDVHLLTSDGTIYTFNRGAETERYAVDGDRDSVSMIAMYGIPETNSIFVVALDNKVAEMIEVDSDSPSRIHYLAPTDSQTDFDATAESAFRGTLDFVVDATTHVVYFVTAEGLWRASFAS
jgi:hypothetical protein